MRGMAAVCFIMLTAGRTLAAQDSPPASPFHGGDWEVQANVGTNLALGNFAILKYSTPTRAWFLSASFNATKPFQSAGISPALTPGYSVFLTAGRRFFRVVTSHALLFVTPNARVDALHNCSTTPICQSGWGAGVGLDLGGEYLLTPFAGLGIVAGGGIDFGHFKELNGGVTTSSTSVMLNVATPVGLIAFLHF